MEHATAPKAHSNPPKRLLGIWAHPDDEAYLSAGLMADVIDAGGEVTIIAITDGEAGFPAEDDRPAPVRAELRRTELAYAMATIGVEQIRHLGVPDGAVADCEPEPIVAQLAAAIAEIRPDAIVTFGPDGITGHEDHVATYRLVTEAWLTCNQGQLWYAAKTEAWLDEWRELHDRFGVWMSDEPTGVADHAVELVVDLDGMALARKRQVMKGHSSQTEGLAAAFGEENYQAWINQETFRRPTDAELQAVDPEACMANWCYSGGAALV